jgi:hypothetical protein
MSAPAPELAAQVVRPDVALGPDECERILEIAYFAIAADARLTDDELEALRRIAGRLRTLAAGAFDAGARLGQRELDALLDRFAETRDREAADERLRELGAKLPRPDLRALAYKIAYALSLVDLDASDQEFEFDLQLIEGLELDQDQAEALAAEVQELFAHD